LPLELALAQHARSMHRDSDQHRGQSEPSKPACGQGTQAKAQNSVNRGSPMNNILLLGLIGLCAVGSCHRSRTDTPSGAGQATDITGSAPASSALIPAPAPSTEAQKKMWTWGFERDTAGQPPTGFSFGRTGGGSPGRWIVRSEGGSNVLAQMDPDSTNHRFPIAFANEPKLQNVRVTVRCKPISGKVDQACGIVARYRDENNYLITRANALEGNIRLYTVKDGKRDEIADHRGPVTANVWHDFRLDVVGDRSQVFWDGSRVIDHRDDTWREAGQVGVWTKADSVTYFDDLTAEAL
jgi:hypothetical protein